MKKVLIAILLLVPLVVVLTINVSSTIISAEIKIELTTLKLTDMDGNVLSYVPVDLDDDNVFLLYASYFPNNASNKDLDWVSSDPSVASVKKRGNYAEITFDYDSYDKAVEISATSRSNGTVRASTTFYITGYVPHRIEFSDWSGESLTQVNLAQGDKFAVKGNVIPAASKGNAKLHWWVSDETVATVDGNGIITGRKKGACELYCQIGEGRGAISASIPVVVNGTSLSNSDAYYTTAPTFNLAQNGDLAEGVTAWVDGVQVDLDQVPTNAKVTLRQGSQTKEISVYRKSAQDLILLNGDILMDVIFAASSSLSKGSGDLRLDVTDIEGNPVTGWWSSSDTVVVTVDPNGTVHAREAGTATLTFHAEGYNDLEVPIEVGGELIGHFNLTLDNADDSRGLGRERVFGVYTCEDKVVTDTLQLAIGGVYPEDVLNHPLSDNFSFASSNTEYAKVDEHGLITFRRAGIGHSVTITAFAKNALGVVADSYTFRLVNGINVGYGKPVQEYDPDEDPDGTVAANLDFGIFEDMLYILNEYHADVEAYGTNASVVLHNNVYYPADRPRPEFYRGIYGNGYTYDGQLHTNCYDQRMWGTWQWGDYLPTLPEYKQNGGYEVVIENLIIQSYRPIGLDRKEVFVDLKQRGGIPVRLSYDYNIPEITITFRYCLFQYAYSHVNAETGNIKLEGCILRNCAAPAILLQSKDIIIDEETGEPKPDGRYADVTIRNCIFSNSIAPAMLSTIGALDFARDRYDRMYYSRLYLEGTNYVYNWRLLEEVQLDIFPPADEHLAAFISIVGTKISDSVREVMQDEANSTLVYTDVNESKYVNFSFLFLGLWTDPKMQENPDRPLDPKSGMAVFGQEDSYRLYELDMMAADELFRSNRGLGILYDSVAEAFNLDFIANRTYMLDPMSAGKPNTKPGEKYEIDDKTIARLHGNA